MTFSLNGKSEKDGSYILFNVNEKILQNEAFGDQIGLRKHQNILWVYENIDLENYNIVEFLENYFTSPIKAINIINKKLK